MKKIKTHTNTWHSWRIYKKIGADPEIRSTYMQTHTLDANKPFTTILLHHRHVSLVSDFLDAVETGHLFLSWVLDTIPSVGIALGRYRIPFDHHRTSPHLLDSVVGSLCC